MSRLLGLANRVLRASPRVAPRVPPRFAPRAPLPASDPALTGLADLAAPDAPAERLARADAPANGEPLSAPWSAGRTRAFAEAPMIRKERRDAPLLADHAPSPVRRDASPRAPGREGHPSDRSRGALPDAPARPSGAQRERRAEGQDLPHAPRPRTAAEGASPLSPRPDAGAHADGPREDRKEYELSAIRRTSPPQPISGAADGAAPRAAGASSAAEPQATRPVQPAAPIGVSAAPERAPAIHVQIGRIEVRAAPPPPPPRPAPRPRPAPALSLADYLAGGKRGTL